MGSDNMVGFNSSAQAIAKPLRQGLFRTSSATDKKISPPSMPLAWAFQSPRPETANPTSKNRDIRTSDHPKAPGKAHWRSRTRPASTSRVLQTPHRAPPRRKSKTPNGMNSHRLGGG